MPQNIALFYFSGTGNTEITAELFQKAYAQSGAQAERIPIENLLKSNTSPDIQKYSLIGIGFPVHAMNAPQIIYDFVKTLPFGSGKKTFIFKTAGEPAPINNGASLRLIKKLRAKGYEVFHDSLIAMPSNFAIKFSAEMEKQLYLTAIRKVEKLSKEILDGKENFLKADMLAKFLSWFGRIEAFGATRFGKHLKISDASISDGCISCDQCVHICPRDNIYRVDGKIRFRGTCIMCMRCMYQCPKRAISPRFLKFSLLKEGYNIRKTIENPEIEGNFITSETKGYFKRFYDYIYKDE